MTTDDNEPQTFQRPEIQEPQVQAQIVQSPKFDGPVLSILKKNPYKNDKYDDGSQEVLYINTRPLNENVMNTDEIAEGGGVNWKSADLQRTSQLKKQYKFLVEEDIDDGKISGDAVKDFTDADNVDVIVKAEAVKVGEELEEIGEEVDIVIDINGVENNDDAVDDIDLPNDDYAEIFEAPEKQTQLEQEQRNPNWREAFIEYAIDIPDNEDGELDLVESETVKDSQVETTQKTNKIEKSNGDGNKDYDEDNKLENVTNKTDKMEHLDIEESGEARLDDIIESITAETATEGVALENVMEKENNEAEDNIAENENDEELDADNTTAIMELVKSTEENVDDENVEVSYKYTSNNQFKVKISNIMLKLCKHIPYYAISISVICSLYPCFHENVKQVSTCFQVAKGHSGQLKPLITFLQKDVSSSTSSSLEAGDDITNLQDEFDPNKQKTDRSNFKRRILPKVLHYIF